MAHCARKDCGCWRPDLLLRFVALGLRVDGAWFCSPACVHAAAAGRLRIQTRLQVLTEQRGHPPVRGVPPLRLGALLLHQGAVTPAQLANALSAQRTSGRRLGAELQHMGLVDSDSVLRALAAQAGISFLTAVDLSGARNAHRGLSLDEVRALGVIPIGAANADRVTMVACQAPVPRAALSALRQLTGWTPTPFLVSDEDWEALLGAYGAPPSHPQRRVQFTTVRDVDEAAAQIAAAAAAQGSITVTEAYCDTATWLRVVGPDAINTLHMTRERGDKWPAATTLH
jgi:hypothetical protein